MMHDHVLERGDAYALGRVKGRLALAAQKPKSTLSQAQPGWVLPLDRTRSPLSYGSPLSTGFNRR